VAASSSSCWGLLRLTELWLALTRLAERAGPQPIGWPKAAHRLGTHLRSLAPLLRARGVEMGAVRTASSRGIVLTCRGPKEGTEAETHEHAPHDGAHDSARQPETEDRNPARSQNNEGMTAVYGSDTSRRRSVACLV